MQGKWCSALPKWCSRCSALTNDLILCWAHCKRLSLTKKWTEGSNIPDLETAILIPLLGNGQKWQETPNLRIFKMAINSAERKTLRYAWTFWEHAPCVTQHLRHNGPRPSNFWGAAHSPNHVVLLPHTTLGALHHQPLVQTDLINAVNAWSTVNANQWSKCGGSYGPKLGTLNYVWIDGCKLNE